MEQKERIKHIVALMDEAKKEFTELKNEEQNRLETAEKEESEMEDSIRIVLDDLKECEEKASFVSRTMGYYKDGFYD